MPVAAVERMSSIGEMSRASAARAASDRRRLERLAAQGRFGGGRANDRRRDAAERDAARRERRRPATSAAAAKQIFEIACARRVPTLRYACFHADTAARQRDADDQFVRREVHLLVARVEPVVVDLRGARASRRARARRRRRAAPAGGPPPATRWRCCRRSCRGSGSRRAPVSRAAAHSSGNSALDDRVARAGRCRSSERPIVTASGVCVIPRSSGSPQMLRSAASAACRPRAGPSGRCRRQTASTCPGSRDEQEQRLVERRGATHVVVGEPASHGADWPHRTAATTASKIRM